ncbi:MAG: cell division protein FtsA [Chloroflexia bacterium]
MPTNDRIIVGVDVGTHKICTIVAEAEPAGMLNVLGVGAVASEGVSKGLITDIVKASGAIAHSLEAAERQSGCRILSAYVSISGQHVSSFNSRGLVSVSPSDHVIVAGDVERAIDQAKAVAMPAGREILHVIPRTYTIDGQEGIRNPVGLSGWRLDVETHLVTGASNVRENLVRCVQQADVEVDDTVLSALAGAEAALTEQEKNLGVVYIDVGHGTTDIAIYVEGSVWHTKSLPIGGWHLSNDLSIVFNIPYEAAEALKLQYGRAVVPGSKAHAVPVGQTVNGKSHPQGGVGVGIASEGGYANGRRERLDGGLIDGGTDDEMLETRNFNDEPKQIGRGELNEVMAARLDQLFGMIQDEIRRSGYEGLLPGGVVMTGGVAAMPGLEQSARARLKMPVRTGRPKRIGGLAEGFDGPAYATSVGLVLWGLRQLAHPQPGSGRAVGSTGRERSIGEPANVLAKWLKRFLPGG